MATTSDNSNKTQLSIHVLSVTNKYSSLDQESRHCCHCQCRYQNQNLAPPPPPYNAVNSVAKPNQQQLNDAPSPTITSNESQKPLSIEEYFKTIRRNIKTYRASLPPEVRNEDYKMRLLFVFDGEDSTRKQLELMWRMGWFFARRGDDLHNGAMSEWMYKNDFDHKAKIGHGAYLDAAIRGEQCVMHGGTKCFCIWWNYDNSKVRVNYKML